VHIFVLFVNRNCVLYYDHKCSLTTPQQYNEKVKGQGHMRCAEGEVKVTWIYIVPSHETSKVLSHGSHSFICK